MRDLKANDKNILHINDAISGTKLQVYYRIPTTQEMVAYQSKLVSRKGKKIVFNIFETRLEFGLKVITGFSEDAFGYDGKAISSDPINPNYRQDWKELLKQTSADIISLVAANVFEGAQIDGGLEMDMEGDSETVQENPI